MCRMVCRGSINLAKISDGIVNLIGSTTSPSTTVLEATNQNLPVCRVRWAWSITSVIGLRPIDTAALDDKDALVDALRAELRQRDTKIEQLTRRLKMEQTARARDLAARYTGKAPVPGAYRPGPHRSHAVLLVRFVYSPALHLEHALAPIVAE